MKKINVGKRQFVQAVVASLFINIVMIILPIAAVGPRTSLIFVKISDAIAAPPGIFVNIFAPKEHSAIAFMLAASESFVFSILFYTAILWLILECVSQIAIHFNKNE
ncbi:MAG: hypothetical protein ABSG62_15460 [Terracidiphilus sp.]